MSPNSFHAWLERLGDLTPQQRGRAMLVLVGGLSNRSLTSDPDTGLLACPHCAAPAPDRYGHVRGQQRWRCKACERTFGASTGTPFRSLHYKLEWRRFVQAMGEGLTVGKAAERCGIHKATAARWRQRLDGLPGAQADVIPPRDARSSPDAIDASEEGRADGLDPRVVRTRQSLHRALLKLIGGRPLDQLTIRDIAAEAGVGYATFFRHYDSKEVLLEEIASGQIARLAAVIMPLVEEANPFAAPAALCQYVSQNRALWSTLLSGSARAIMQREFIGYAEAHGLLRSSESMPVDLGSIHGVSATLEILSWWLRHAEHFAPEQVAGLIHQLVMTPLMAGSAPRHDPTPGRAGRVK
jgi:transposase-like protein/AcrR family transcriptional regulator